MTDRRKERDRARRKRRKAREADERRRERGTAASTSWWKLGAATTRASMRKTGRICLHEGGCFWARSHQMHESKVLASAQVRRRSFLTAALAAWLYMRSASNNPTRPS